MSALSASGGRWAIATPHASATEAGAEAFELGGNAVDAALAAATTLAVVYPHMCGVGGDLFALVHRSDGETLAVNSGGRAPRMADAADLHARHEQMPERGPIPITVPGAVAGWRAVHDLGAVRPWASAFDLAVRLASDGAPAARSLSGLVADDPDLVLGDEGLSRVFAPGGSPVREGAPIHQPELAETLRRIAGGGAGEMYGGDVGRRYVDGLRAAGSPIGLEDLASHQASVLAPLRHAFSDRFHVSAVPPNSQGFVLLQILALVDRLGLVSDPFGTDVGALAHVMRAASADRERHLGDPAAMTVHPSTLLDDGHLAGLADGVRASEGVALGRAADRGASRDGADQAASGDTIALVAADASGFAVSLIQSLYNGFGSGILEPSTGVVAHNRGACFALRPGHPNDFAPGKLPAHTLMPVLVHDDRGLAAVAGTMGGHAQPQINAHTLLRTLGLGASPAEAVAAPRWLVSGMDPDPTSSRVVAESDVPPAALDALQAAGFDVDTVGTHDEGVGHAHVIRVGPDGFDAGTDPRADGSALAG